MRPRAHCLGLPICPALLCGTHFMLADTASFHRAPRRMISRLLIAGAVFAVVALLVWQGLAVGGNPDPLAPHADSGVAILDIAVLVFREGLECILVLAAITASMVGPAQAQQRPVALGALIAFGATLVTWRVAVTVVDNLSENFPALQVQAATGLLAVVVLLVVMNWFFHRLYWTGWITAHTQRKRKLLKTVDETASSRKTATRLLWGLGLLGFTSLYREGFEVVLFLQNYRLKLGGTPVFRGVVLGLVFTGIVAILTFLGHRRLPYRKMLVLTGVLLGVVLIVMVGEQAQEMQLAHWLPTTPIRPLDEVLRPWMGLWFSLFPTVETLAAQGLAAALVLGSYVTVRLQLLHARTPSN
ncbi:MAG: hypothetical protein NVS4B3_04840 [Gemmatimonadaceae bacterium]